MAKIHGRNGQIAISASTSPAGSPADQDFTAVGSLSGWNISFARDTVETTSFGDTNKTYLAGLQDVSGGFDGFFDTDVIQTLIEAGDDADAVWVRITPSTDYPAIYFQGSAWLSVSMTGAVGDAVKVTGTFSANGPWQKSYQ